MLIVKMSEPYSTNIEVQMQAFYQSLSEKDRRRYAAIEAEKLGHGGLTYIARVLGCTRRTIAQGVAELSDAEALRQTRIRAKGGGRKSAIAVIPQLETAFLKVIEDHTAGSPMTDQVKWTNLTKQEIVAGLRQHDIKVSVTVVTQLLQKHLFVARQAQKRKSSGEAQDRAKQFARITELKAEYLPSPNPIISIDTKKKS
jgi:hypothetical protein